MINEHSHNNANVDAPIERGNHPLYPPYPPFVILNTACNKHGSPYLNDDGVGSEEKQDGDKIENIQQQHIFTLNQKQAAPSNCDPAMSNRE